MARREGTLKGGYVAKMETAALDLLSLPPDPNSNMHSRPQLATPEPVSFLCHACPSTIVNQMTTRSLSFHQPVRSESQSRLEYLVSGTSMHPRSLVLIDLDSPPLETL